MQGTKSSTGTHLAPDQKKLTAIQASRLSALTRIDVKHLTGQTVAEIAAKWKWHIDPALFLFERICGRVVKKDPVTGVEYPVPFATVHVEDTDCSFVGYFPKPWPWGWMFPFWCHREELGEVTTDSCGNFCIWIPRFEIDWIVRWRKERICFPDFFLRPSIKDLLPRELPHIDPGFPPHGPGPDPGPLDLLSKFSLPSIEAISGPAARDLARRFQAIQSARTLGARAESLDRQLNARAFETELPPPLPHEFRKALVGRADVASEKRANAHEAIRSAVAMKLGVEASELGKFQLSNCIGPFFHCIDIFVPEWQLILDVPDITFRVTQDTNGDGVEETIYSEGFFDVRWDATSIPDVTLVASSIAKESHACDAPVVPCGNAPALLFAGLMPLADLNYFDSVEGYATRPNRPLPPSGPRPAAQTPFLQTLQLYGCVNIPGAKYYRVLQSTDDGATFSAITGLQWNIFPIPSGSPLTISADSSGWYDVLTNPDSYHPARMVIEWPTPTLGKRVLKIEVGDASKAVLQSSAPVALRLDNTTPTVVFNTLAWKFSTEPDSAFYLPGRDLLVTCPTIRRGASPQDIEVQFDALVSANHLRDASIGSFGCGGGSFALTTSASSAAHWHDDVNDNSVFLSGRYRLDHTALEGAYGFECVANSRAMNPSGADGGHLADWFYDPIYVYANPQVRVAIVNG